MDTPTFEQLIDADQPEESERKLVALLAQSRRDGIGDLTFQIELSTQIARMQVMQRKFTEARATLKEVETQLGDANSAYRAAAKIRYLLEAGRLAVADKTPSQAQLVLREAVTLASNAGEDYYGIDALQQLAAAEPKKMRRAWTEKALLLATNSPQVRAQNWRGPLLTTLGWLDFEVRQFDSALENFRKALSLVRTEDSPKKAVVAKWAVARTLRALNRVEEALEIQRDLVAELGRISLADGYVYEELAECLQFLKKASEAQVYFELAYGVLSKDEWFSDNSPARLKRLKELGKAKY